MREDCTAGDIAWAAGLFEGEGCMSIFRGRQGNPRIKATLAMSDGDVVERFARIVGHGTLRKNINSNRPAHWKSMDQWTVYEGAKACEVIRMLMPWFGERRYAKAVEFLAIGDRVKPIGHRKTHCDEGHPLSGDNVYIEWDRRHAEPRSRRRCKICRRAYGRDRMRAQRERERAAA